MSALTRTRCLLARCCLSAGTPRTPTPSAAVAPQALLLLLPRAAACEGSSCCMLEHLLMLPARDIAAAAMAAR
jgi:hypothetical protein